MDIKATIVDNWPIALGGVIGIFVVYKYVYSGGSSTAQQSSGQFSVPSSAQLQYQAASNVLSAQTASDMMHANVALSQIEANQQTANLATTVGGTVAMARIHGTSSDLEKTLATQYATSQLYSNVAMTHELAPIEISKMEQQTAQFNIATSGAIDMMKVKGVIDIGLTNAQGLALQNIILANNQVPLATIAASSLANVSAINSARDIALADINSQTNLMYAQAKVIEAQSLEPIAYFKSAADVQMSYNANLPKLVAPAAVNPTVAPPQAFTGYDPSKAYGYVAPKDRIQGMTYNQMYGTLVA